MKITSSMRNHLTTFSRSVWLIPVILTVILIILTSLRLSGSSIGMYYSYFYPNQKDPNLILNGPRPIRSDEFSVNTQMAIAQLNNDYKEINNNLGNGIDMSLIIDAPYKGWTAIFKPHNLAFLVIPFDNAFAFKWWSMGYFLILSVYFFSLLLLPGKRLFAALLGLSVFLAPFVQWWYQYITLAPIYYTLFSGGLFILLSRAKTTRNRLFYSMGLAYTLTSLALVQYPAFQIPLILVMASFVLGYLLFLYKEDGKKRLKQTLLFSAAACMIAISITGIFLYTKRDAVTAIANTAYPGDRDITSGGYNFIHLLSGLYSFRLQSDTTSKEYVIPDAGALNQSEASNFILLLPFLILPSLLLIYRTRDRVFNSPLLMQLVVLFVLLMWLFIPHIDWLGDITLLNQVPHPRLLIGIGLINIILFILFIRAYEKAKKFSLKFSLIYSLLSFVLLLLIAWKLEELVPDFLGAKVIWGATSLMALSLYLLLRRNYEVAIALICVLSLVSVIKIHPVYRGTAVIRENKVSQSIKSISSKSSEKWVAEDSALQSFAFINGQPSLTGIYTYPQLSLWQSIPGPSSIYNRYAHVNFVLDRDGSATNPTQLTNSTGDHFGVFTEPCSEFMKKSRVEYILTSGLIETNDAQCAQLFKVISLEDKTLRIYKLSF